MLKTKLLTIAFGLILIFTGLAVWANNTMYNLSQKVNKPKYSNATGPTQPSPSTNNESAQLVQLAKEDAVSRFNLSEAEIKVIEVNQVNWGDSSLGCPKIGEFYTQVITPGWKIKFQADNNIFEYHTDKQYVKYCNNP